ncbi:glutamine--tRNA ligase, partial [Striga asiatica]
YVARVGFSVRKRSYRKDKDNIIKMQHLLVAEMDKELNQLLLQPTIKNESEARLTGMVYIYSEIISNEDGSEKFLWGQNTWFKRMRWRRDVCRSYQRVKINYNGLISTLDQLRYDHLCRAFAAVADTVANDDVRVGKLIEWIGYIQLTKEWIKLWDRKFLIQTTWKENELLENYVNKGQ